MDGVDVFAWDVVLSPSFIVECVWVWMDRFMRAVAGGELGCGGAAFVGGFGILNNKLVLLPTLPIVGLGLLLP